MKKLLSIFLLFSSLAGISQTKFTAPAIRNSSSDTYNTHYDSLGNGGFMALADTFTRNALPTLVRKKGMLVSVKDTVFYQLVGGIANSNWVRIFFTTSQVTYGGGVDSITINPFMGQICAWSGGNSTCYALGSFYDSAHLNFDSTYIKFFNAGNFVDSIWLPKSPIFAGANFSIKDTVVTVSGSSVHGYVLSSTANNGQSVSDTTSPNFIVLDSLNTPPVSPSTGDVYEVGTSPTGVWVGHATQIATWNGSAWTYQTPTSGNLLINAAANNLASKFNATVWVRTGKLIVHANGDPYPLIIGPTSNNGMNFITNNVTRIILPAAGGITLSTLAGTGTALLNISSTGVLSRLAPPNAILGYLTKYNTYGSFLDTARTAITLTTAGSSGPATYTTATGVLNIPQYSGGGAISLTAGLGLTASPSTITGTGSYTLDTSNASVLSRQRAAATYEPIITILGVSRGGTGANLSATGGSKQVLQQATAGSVVTVTSLDSSYIPGIHTQPYNDLRYAPVSGYWKTTGLNVGLAYPDTTIGIGVSTNTGFRIKTNGKTVALYDSVGQLTLTKNTGTALLMQSGSSITWLNREVNIGLLSTSGFESISLGYSNNGSASGSVLIGKGNNDGGFGNSIIVRNSASGFTLTGTNTINVLANNTSGIGLGPNATTSGNTNSTEIAIGSGATANGAGIECSIAIGRGTTASGNYAIALGAYSVAGAGEFVSGSSGKPMTDVYFGSGKINSGFGTTLNGNAWTLHGAGAFGTDTSGGAMYLAGGKGTGAGTGGDVVLQTSTRLSTGTTLQTLSDRWYVKGNTGTLSNTITPVASALLDVNSTTKGVIFPRMTTTQKNAISSTAEGLLLYDTDLKSTSNFNGTQYNSFGNTLVLQPDYFTPSTGGTITTVKTFNIIDPAGTLAALTITLPSSPTNGQVVEYSFSQIVTALTFSGGTLANSTTTTSAGGHIRFMYNSTSTKWHTF